MVDGFSYEVTALPRGPAAAVAAERLLCKFLRQGVEVLTVAALVDAAATVAHVAMHLTSALLRAAKGSGPSPALERRCKGLLAALAEIPKTFQGFLADAKDRLENQAAAEWLGCDEAAGGVPTETFASTWEATGDSSGRPDVNASPHAAHPTPTEVPAPKLPEGLHALWGPTVAPAKKPPAPPSAALVMRVEPRSSELAARSPRRGPDAYQDTEEWRKVRAYCVRHRICVDYNRDRESVRCSTRFAECPYRHVCAMCSAEEKGGPGAQHFNHGAWNCERLSAWLLSHH